MVLVFLLQLFDFFGVDCGEALPDVVGLQFGFTLRFVQGLGQGFDLAFELVFLVVGLGY